MGHTTARESHHDAYGRDAGACLTQYRRGAAFEYRVRDALMRLGYHVVRAAGSHGIADLIALHRERVLLVQCKRNGVCPPGERVALEQLAESLTGRTDYHPILAGSPQRGVLRFSEVIDGAAVHDPDLRPRPL